MALELNSTRKGKATFWELIHMFHGVVSGPLRGQLSDQVLTITMSFFLLSKSCSFWHCVSLQGLVGLLYKDMKDSCLRCSHTRLRVNFLQYISGSNTQAVLQPTVHTALKHCLDSV